MHVYVLDRLKATLQVKHVNRADFLISQNSWNFIIIMYEEFNAAVLRYKYKYCYCDAWRPSAQSMNMVHN